MSIWKTPDQKPTSDNDIVCMVGDLPFVGHYDNDYQAYLEHASGDCYAVDEIDRWAYLSDIIAQAEKAEWLQIKVDLLEHNNNGWAKLCEQKKEQIQRLQKIAERQNEILQDNFATLGYYIGKEVMDMSDEIKQLIKETTNDK